MIAKNPSLAIYDELDTPDIEFYSPDPLKDLIKLCDMLSMDSLDDIYFSVATLRYLPSSILGRLEIREPKKKQITLERRKNKNESGVSVNRSLPK